MTHESEQPVQARVDSITPDPADSSTPPSPAAETPAVDIAAIRELVLRAHPDVVPELVSGDTVDDLLASIEPAEAAWRRISASLRESNPAAPPAPAVPAGGERPMPVDPDRLPSSEKIRRGLAQR